MRILYAEDEKLLSMAIAENLKMEHYEVETDYDGEEALEHLKTGIYDAAVLDIMMPKADGIEVLRQMRERNDFTPTLLLTAKAETEDRINGLSVGADDYLGKPFAAGELLARLNALIRRSATYKVKTLNAGNIVLDCETNELCSDVGSLRLSSKEAQLLALFMQNREAKLSAAELGARLWKDGGERGAAELYVSYLQNKLRQLGAKVNIVKNAENKYCMGEVK